MTTANTAYPVVKDFKDRKSFATRRRDSESISALYSDKIPLIIERFKNEKALPVLDKIKYLVPFDMTMGTLASIIRKRLQLNPTQALFLLVNNKLVFSASMSLLDIYREQKDDDGFLYIVYASQETFGGSPAYKEIFGDFPAHQEIFGANLTSHETFGENHAQQETFGENIASQGTFGSCTASQETFGENLASQETFRFPASHKTFDSPMLLQENFSGCPGSSLPADF